MGRSYPTKKDILEELEKSNKNIRRFKKTFTHYKEECIQATNVHIELLKDRLKNKEYL